AGRHAIPADEGHADVVEVREELHGGLDDPREEPRAEARAVEPLVLIVELPDRALAAPEDLYQRVPAMHLLDVALRRAGLGPPRDELLLRAPGDHDRDGERQRD